MYVCVDFDGTMVTHDYPAVGRDIGAWEWLKKAQDKGAKIILFTMRSGVELGHAVETCHENGIFLFGINSNPTQSAWTDSPKAYGNIYIDDAALGTPLIYPERDFDLPPGIDNLRPYVDWEKVGPMLMKKLEEAGLK